MGTELEFVKLLPGKDKPSLGVKEMAGEVNPIPVLILILILILYNIFRQNYFSNISICFKEKRAKTKTTFGLPKRTVGTMPKQGEEGIKYRSLLLQGGGKEEGCKKVRYSPLLLPPPPLAPSSHHNGCSLIPLLPFFGGDGQNTR